MQILLWQSICQGKGKDQKDAYRKINQEHDVYMVYHASLTLESPKTDIILSAIEKTGIPNGKRISIKTEKAGNTLKVLIEAKDPVALRAGLNSFMNLYNLSDNIIKGIIYDRKR